MKRQYFIKDLYDSKKILENFQTIEFESLIAFYNVFNNKIYSIKEGQNVIIDISKENISLLNRLLNESYLTDKTNISLYFIKWEDFVDFIKNLSEEIAKKHFTIIINEPKEHLQYLYELNNNFLFYTKENPIWVKTKITSENYKNQLNDIITLYNNKNFRFFELEFDYASFDKITLKEVRSLEWHIGQFMQWYSGTREKKFNVDPIVLNRIFFNKTVFLANDLKLYINKTAFNEGEILFDIQEHLKDDGETIDYHELANLRVYMDIDKDYMIPNLKRYNFLDFYQNRKILGEYIEIPLICQLISGWLNV